MSTQFLFKEVKNITILIKIMKIGTFRYFIYYTYKLKLKIL